MSNTKQQKWTLPQEMEGTVPSAEQILKALGDRTYTYESDRTFVRAVDDVRYVATASPFRAHRFGPPLELVEQNGRLPFTWVYLGMDSLVASWESQLVKNNRGAGSGFHITRKAEEAGILAAIQFARPLLLWSLGEDHSSRLGFQDAISERDHETCQWFGLRLREAMLLTRPHERPDGVVYPSHRVKGYPALALAEWAAVELFESATVTYERFAGSAIYKRFGVDPMRTEPPELDAC